MVLETSFSLSSSSSCSFSPSSFSYARKYDVFLSFRGPDIRLDFIGHLHKALSDKGIRTYIDDEELRRGEEISPSLAKAIEESRIAIPVFSKSYASSSFCLDELVKIMECVKEKRLLVFPVFYKVEPHNVRHQSGSFGEAWTERVEKRFKDDKGKVQRWKEALQQAASFSGDHFKTGYEYERDFIDKIVREISNRISPVLLHVADYPVGLESRVLEVSRLLNDGSDDRVHMVGICGIGGIGKTTLARAVYNSVANQFEGLCFIENMSELSDRRGLVHIQKMVLRNILGDKVYNLGSVGEGVSIIKERLRSKKVLLVLDNVDKDEDLRAIIGGFSEFGSGSRVIITSRDKQLLTSHGVVKPYEVEVLNEEEAVTLFSWKAFKFEKVEPCYIDILKKLVTLACRLPLALELIGASLSGKCVQVWIAALDVYRKIPHRDVQMKLKVSFDALSPIEKDFFLDIACYFNGHELARVKDILHAHYGVNPTLTIQVLVDKSFIKVNNGFHNVITLHGLIQDMGREIVRLESPGDPGARSRLWLAKDIIEVLQGDKGSSKIQVINLGCDNDGAVIEWDGQAFRKMENLKTLVIGKCRFSQGPKHLPNSLRVLIWEACSLEEFSPCFNPKHLVILELPRKRVDSVQLAELFKKFENMKLLKLDYCKCITNIPSLTSAPELEVLSFAGCDYLTEVDESVGFLDKLKTLNANGCNELRSLQQLALPSLERLDLDGCKSLGSFPEIQGKMEKMTELSLTDVPVKKFPPSIHNLTGLQSLYLCVGEIFELPSIIPLPEVRILRFECCKGLQLTNEEEGEEQVSSLSFSNKTTELDIIDCKISEEFLRIALPMFPRLQSLRLRRENFRIVPECIGECQLLRRLHLIDCEELVEIRGIPTNIEELFVVNCRFLSSSTIKMLLNEKLHEKGQDKMLILPGERLPMWFENQRRDLSISFWFRNKFPAISFGLFTRRDPLDQRSIRPRLTINGAKSFELVLNDSKSLEEPGVGHILIFSKTQTTFRDQVGEGLSENEWNRAVLSVYGDPPWWYNINSDYIELGIHIIKEKSCMDDIRFTDPLSPNRTYSDHSSLKKMSSKVGGLKGIDDDSWRYDVGLLSPLPRYREPLDCVNLISNLMQSASSTHTILDHAGQFSNVIEAFEEGIDDLFNEAEEQSSIREQKASSSSVKTPLDPLVELERLLLGSCDLTSESNPLIAASSDDIQASEVVIILQNLETLLDKPLKSLIADGEIKHQILDCLSKLMQLENHIPIPLQSIVAQVRDFYEDVTHNFPSIEQTLVDYSRLEETRSKFLENLKEAKVKQAQIDAKVSQVKNQLEQLAAEIADLEIKLKDVVEKRNELQLAIKNGEAEKNKIFEDASAWLLESKQVVKKMKSSEHAYKDAQNSKARLEERLAKLKGAFAEVRSCPYESSIHSENVDQPMNSLDPLAELERVLQGSHDVSPESTSPTAASCSEIQSSEVRIILQNLKPSLDNRLENLIAEGEIKQQIMDCLSKLGQLEDHIPISLQSIVAQVRDFYEGLIHSFPSIQQTLVDYSCLEETRFKFFENLTQAKVKQARIEVKVSQEKNQLEEVAAEITDLELKLKAAVKKQNELQLAIKNGAAEKNKILEDASAWLMESKQVVKKLRSSEHAYKDAQNSKARLEGRLAELKGAFAANKP